MWKLAVASSAFVALCGHVAAASAQEWADVSNAVVLVRPGERSTVEQTAATMLIEEVEKRTGLQWTQVTAAPGGKTATISLSVGGDARPDLKAEGYSVAVDADGTGPPVVRIVGADGRGVLYGVGKFLRSMDCPCRSRAGWTWSRRRRTRCGGISSDIALRRTRGMRGLRKSSSSTCAS